jgi:hypothetical protein
MYRTCIYYFNQYCNLVIKYWNRMTPAEYFGLLVLIALAGWLLMRSANKRC